MIWSKNCCWIKFKPAFVPVLCSQWFYIWVAISNTSNQRSRPNDFFFFFQGGKEIMQKH